MEINNNNNHKSNKFQRKPNEKTKSKTKNKRERRSRRKEEEGKQKEIKSIFICFSSSLSHKQNEILKTSEHFLIYNSWERSKMEERRNW